MNDEILRKLYGEYVKGVEREGKKGAVMEPLSYAYWKADYTKVLSETPKTGKEYSMTELRNVNKMIVRSSKNQLSRKQARAFENAFMSEDWGDDVSPEEAVEIHEYLKSSGFYEARERGELRHWMAFHGRDLYDFLDALQLASWHKFFNS